MLPRCANTRNGDSEILPGLHETLPATLAETEMAAFRDNEASSCATGLHVEAGCQLSRFTASRCSRYGLLHNSRHGLIARALTLADNRVSVAGNPDLSGTRILIEDSVLVGHSDAVASTSGLASCRA